MLGVEAVVDCGHCLGEVIELLHNSRHLLLQGRGAVDGGEGHVLPLGEGVRGDYLEIPQCRVIGSFGRFEGLLGKVASTVWRVEDLVVEDGEVESETKADGVGRGQLGLGDVGGAL